MKSVFSAIAGGMGFLFIGLLLEFLALPGMCSRTGYWHLKKLDSFFYALHSETNVILIASACNFIIGSVLGFIAGLISTNGKNGTIGRNS